MFRFAQNSLASWKSKPSRKPLILRGARQVGKSFLVREFGKAHFADVVEVNFERHPEAGAYFKGNAPLKILKLIEATAERPITPGKTLLFLDEIQSAPDVLPMLRYFYEEIPELHVIAAGSLLEFVLSEHEFSMPVGRVEFMRVYPMTFTEFLLATHGQEKLDYLRQLTIAESIPEELHRQYLEALREYSLIGGMPEAVKTWMETKLFTACEEVKHNLIAALQSDFAKYRRRIPYERLQTCFRVLPTLAGQKIKYVNMDPHDTAKNLSAALELLEMAQLIYRVFHASGNGVALGAQRDVKVFKSLFLDVGLMSTLCGLKLTHLEGDLTLAHQGGISEQLAGQELLASFPTWEKPEVYCWMREKKSASAEVDYLVSLETQIIPVEVKSGKTGRLKSLAIFAREKNTQLALRFNADKPSITRGDYTLVSLPLYLAGEWRRLLNPPHTGTTSMSGSNSSRRMELMACNVPAVELGQEPHAPW